VSATLPLWLDLVIAALLVVGAAFALVGSFGLARLGDFYQRLHGPSKATTLGVGCVLAASALWFGWRDAPSLHEVLIAVFLFFTAPVSAHLLTKAALKRDCGRRPDDAPPPSAGALTTPPAGRPAADTGSRSRAR
jgi:multicomponent K+:H+ antiporter subunit G